METLIISEVFSDAPGGRLRSDGPKSGQQFREEFLVPALEQISNGDKLLIDLDGGFGYATSFLEEAFGGLSRLLGSKNVLSKLEFKSDEEPKLIVEIINYIKHGND
jgi:hypothetical protein